MFNLHRKLSALKHKEWCLMRNHKVNKSRHRVLKRRRNFESACNHLEPLNHKFQAKKWGFMRKCVQNVSGVFIEACR